MKVIRQKGFTVVEVLVSMAVFGVVMAAMPAVFVAHAKINERMTIKTGALAAGQLVMDAYRAQDLTTLPASGEATAQTVTVNERNFTVTPIFCENASFCLTEKSRHIKLVISYEGEDIASLETVYTSLR